MSANLKDLTTFQVDAHCAEIVPIFSEQDIYRFMDTHQEGFKILGGGSNVLITDELTVPVLLNRIKGIRIIDEDEHALLVQVGGGEIWHNLVMWSVSHQLYGLQNLALIPGTVGAAPMQNIGAYGVEQCESFHSLNAVDLETGINQLFFKRDCKFGYRESIFKKEVKGRYFITQVTYRLEKDGALNTSYGAIASELENRGIKHPTVKDVAETVIKIRQSKLPDPKDIHNAGSFFKNPIITEDLLQRIKSTHTDVVFYEVEDGYKIPAAWLIERAGLKGYRKHDAGVYDNHALVIVNHGNATGKELKEVAFHVKQVVKDQFGIDLQPEVNIW